MKHFLNYWLFSFVLLPAYFLFPGFIYAIEIHSENTAGKTEAEYYIEADGLSDSGFVSGNAGSFVGLLGGVLNNGASAFITVSGGSSPLAITNDQNGAHAEVSFNAEGDFSSSPKNIYDAQGHLIDVRPAQYQGGAYAGLKTTLVTAPSSKSHLFWGTEVDGMPVLATWKTQDSLSVNPGTNVNVEAYYDNYQYSQQAFKNVLGDKFDGGGIISVVTHQLPENYRLTTHEGEVQLTGQNRVSGSSFESGEWIGAHTDSRVTQLGNKLTLSAEADFKANTVDHRLPSQTGFDTVLSYSVDVKYIDPKDVALRLIPDVPRITQFEETCLVCRHASQAMIAKYWANWEKKYLGEDSILLPNDTNLMLLFAGYQDDYPNKHYHPSGNLNRFFNEIINPNINNKEDVLIAYDSFYLSAEKFAKDIEKGHPVYLQGDVLNGTDAYGHAAVAYGFLNAAGTPWIALNDTWDPIYKVRTAQGDRIWVQNGGVINNNDKGYNYDTVRWYPVPDVEKGEVLLFLDDNTAWKWQQLVLTSPLKETPWLAQYLFNSPAELDSIEPISNPLGEMNMRPAPEQLGADGNVLYLLSPDGNPIGFGLDTILPEDFQIQFKYAGFGEGILQLLLDDSVFNEVDFNNQNLEELLSFDETFHTSALGFKSYRLHRLSFVLKGKSDPELYFDDLFIRNLNFGTPAAGVPEPASFLPLGLGLGGLIFRTRQIRRPSYHSVYFSFILAMLFSSFLYASEQDEIEANIEKLKDIHQKVSSDAQEALIKKGSDAVNPLIVYFSDENNRVETRCSAAEALGKIGDKRAIEPLIASLNKNEYLSRCAARALGDIGDKKAVEPLMAWLSDNSKDDFVLGAAAEALGKIGDPRAAKILVSHLVCCCSNINDYVKEALVKIGQPAVDPLIDYLQKGGCVVESVADVLGKIGDKRAIKSLIICLKDSYARNREAAAEALIKIGYEPADLSARILLLLAKDDLDAVAKIGAPAIDPLVSYLNADFPINFLAAKALSKIGGPRVFELMVASLKDKNRSVRMASVFALGEIGDKRAIDPLVTCLKDEDEGVRRQAASALGKIGIR